MGLRGIGAKPIKSKRSRKVSIRVVGETRAEKVISFIEGLPVTAGILTGKKFKLGNWQKEIIQAIYKTNGDNKRIVRQALITIPRKNGKTTFTAALALCHLCGPEAESRGEIYSAAAERNQASIIFREMKAMIQATNLIDRVIVRDWAKSLEDSVTGSIYQALSADVQTKHGFNASMWIYDELAQAPNRALYDVLNTSGGGRVDPLGIVISTQSPDPNSIMSELVDDGQRIISGEVTDPTFYPIIYAAPEDSDPWDEKTWLECNPAIESGFRSLEEMKTAAIQAKRIPAREPAFRLLYLNQRVAMENRFIAMPDWDECQGSFDSEELKGRICYGGLDLARTTDLAAYVLVFPPKNALTEEVLEQPQLDDCYIVLPYFWVPGDDFDTRSRRDRVPYALWAKEGMIIATAGRSINNKAIIRVIDQSQRDFDLKMIAYDRAYAGDVIRDLVDEYGFTEDVKEYEVYGKPFLHKFGQGYLSMSSPTKELYNLIVNRRIMHGGHPVLRWNAANCVVTTDPAENIKPDKAKSTARIDGITALIEGLFLAIKFGSKDIESPYERRLGAEGSIVRSI